MNLEAFRNPGKFDLTGFLFVITMGIVLNPSIMGFSLPQGVVFAIVALWLLAALLFACGRHSWRVQRADDGAFSSLARCFLTPKLIVWAYGIMLYIVGIGNRAYFSTGATQVASVILPICALYLLRAKTVDYIFWSCVVSFIPVVIFTCVTEGISSLGAPFLSIIDSVSHNPFENHQFTFTAAFLLIYYLCLREDCGSRDIFPVLACAVMVFMGFKRILVLSILPVVLLSLICRKISPRARRRICRYASACLFIACWIWIWSIYSGSFFHLVDALGIQTMSRIYYYKVVADSTSFSPLFPGMGLNAVANMLTTTYSYLNVGGVHSDILKYYAEIGFIGFFAWSWFYLFSLPKMIERRLGDSASYGFYLINIFTFIIYFTDNIDIYFGSQFLYVSIPFVYAMVHAKGYTEPTRKGIWRRSSTFEISAKGRNVKR